MNRFASGKRDLHPKRVLSSSPRSRQHLILSRVVFPFLLCLLFFSGVLNNGMLTFPQAHAASRPLVPVRATTTLGTFLAQKAPSLHPFVYPEEQSVSPLAKELQRNTPKVLPSTEPVHMAPLHQALSPAFLASSTSAPSGPLQVHGSDGRLTVSIPAGAIDASQATTANKSLVASVGTGAPSNQAPPKPLLATVQPNTGQLSYAYPITLAPGPNGTTPTVQLIYSSEGTNQRYETSAPADSPGEGWGISMGAISMTNYPAGSALSGNWHFLSGVDNVSDRLIPTTTGSTTYYTEHVSRLKIQRVTPSGATQPCFHVWDPSGTYYEYGCTSDSLQYSTNTSGTRTNYRWDLDRVVPANEGPSTMTAHERGRSAPGSGPL